MTEKRRSLRCTSHQAFFSVHKRMYFVCNCRFEKAVCLRERQCDRIGHNNAVCKCRPVQILNKFCKSAFSLSLPHHGRWRSSDNASPAQRGPRKNAQPRHTRRLRRSYSQVRRGFVFFSDVFLLGAIAREQAPAIANPEPAAMGFSFGRNKNFTSAENESS